MSAKRTLLVSAAVVAGLAALAAAAAFNPTVQTWAARRALDEAAPGGATVERVSAGLGHLSIQGLRIERGGAVLAVPDAQAQLGVVPAILGRGYLVRTLVAKGWTLDLTRSRPALSLQGPEAPAPTASPVASRAIAAVLAAFNVPAGLSLDGVDLEGIVLLPGEGGSPVGRARVSLRGGGLAAGQQGRFTCDVAAALDDPAAPVSSVGVHADLSATMNASGTFTRVGLKAEATASGREFPKGIGLSATASAARGAGKTTYSVALVRGDAPIASVDADSPDGSRRVSGSWRLDLKDTDLAPFALGRRLPVFYVAGSGSYGLNAATGDALARGRMQASADRLGILAPGLDALGRLDLSADFDLARAGDSLRVDRLEASLSGESPVGSVRALQPFEFNVATGELKVARPSGDLVGISAKGIPLAWFRGGLGGLKLGGGDLRGEFVMRAENGRLALRTKAPLSSSGVSLSAGGRRIADGLDVSSYLLADYSPEGWQLQVAPLEARYDGVLMLSVEARFGRLAGRGQSVKAAGSWNASLPVLLSQPFAARAPRLSAGDATGSFEASLGSVREMLVKVAVKDLALADGARALPSFSSQVRADFDSDGRVAFNLPLRLDYGDRASNLVLSGTLSTRGGPRVDAALSAERLSRADAGVIAALSGAGAFVGPPPAAAPAGPAASGPSAPFWPAVPGRLTYVIGELDLARFALRNVRGNLYSDAASLRVESGMAAVGEAGAVRYEGELSFSPGTPAPYSLKAALSVDNVDSAPVFRAIDPDRPPAIEGRFSAQGRVVGSGGALTDLLQALQGGCTLASKDGQFRGLRTDSIEAVRQAPSAIVNAIDTVSSLFGKKSDKIGEALVEAAGGLSEIHYDQMGIAADRGADLDIRLTEISLIAPEARITGTGRISHADGVPIEWQPLSVDLDVGVRGKLGGVLGIIGMLKDGKDELGYTQLYQPVHLGGTLRNIDQSQWKEMLIQAPLRKGGGLFDKLLGK